MNKNTSFKIIKRDKKIVLTIVGLFFALALTSLIVTSWFKYDQDISNTFGKAVFDSAFARGWAGYFIIDANILIISVAIPAALLLVESFYKWRLDKNKNGLLSRNKKSILWFYWIIGPVYTIVVLYVLANVVFSDYGFGNGFYFWLMIGYDYIIPIFIVSILLNLAISYSLMYFVHNNLAKRDDFLTSGYWKKSLATFFYLIIIYIIVLILKSGFGRPYDVDLKWHSWMNKIEQLYPERYNNYMNQFSDYRGWIDPNNKDIIGWNDNSFPSNELNWPWWKVGKGFFDTKSSVYNNLPTSDAFPSGHMVATTAVGLFMYMFFSNSKTKKGYKFKWFIIIASVIYLLNMIFCLAMSMNHWWSDMAFTLTIAPFIYGLSYVIAHHSVKLPIWRNKEYVKIKIR